MTKIYSLCSSKLNIILSCISFFTLLMDVESVVKNITQNFVYMVLTCLFGGVLLFIHFKRHTDLLSAPVPQNDLIDNGPTATNQPKSLKRGSSFMIKLIFALLFSSGIMVAGAVYYLYKLPVHYVVLEKNITNIDKAKKKADRYTAKFTKIPDVNYKATILRMSSKGQRYMITVNGGYLFRSDAENVNMRLNESRSSSHISSYVSKPVQTAHITRKIVYVNHTLRDKLIALGFNLY